MNQKSNKAIVRMQKTVATALLLNWKRPDSLKKTIESIRDQSVPIEIFLWNNNPEDKTRYDVDLQIDSSSNLVCWPRWFMAQYAQSEFVFSLDDDIYFKDEGVIDDCLIYANRFIASQSENIAIGLSGVRLLPQKGYWSSKHIYSPSMNGDFAVDVLKGKFIFARKGAIVGMPAKPQSGLCLEEPHVEDDILISSHLRHKIIPSFLHSRLCSRGNDDPCALYKQPEHEQRREKALIDFYK